jgi:hypothetical protein
MKRDVQIAVITYNDFPLYPKGVKKINGIWVLLMPKIFNPKSRDRPCADDPDFQKIVGYKPTLKYLIVFLGKESSGSYKMIDIFNEYFGDRVQYRLCHHSWEEKAHYLLGKGVSMNNVRVFIDLRAVLNPTLQCDETPALSGALQCFMHVIKST